MPSKMLKNQAEKYGCSIKDAEKYWKEAKKDASKSYDKKDDKYWGTVTKILKNKLNKHCEKNEGNILKFNEYNENVNLNDLQLSDEEYMEKEMFSINDIMKFQKEKGYNLLTKDLAKELLDWKNSWENWGNAI